MHAESACAVRTSAPGEMTGALASRGSRQGIAPKRRRTSLALVRILESREHDSAGWLIQYAR
jgi:hypothetical protein